MITARFGIRVSSLVLLAVVGAGCASPGPRPECPENPSQAEVALSCERAVATARAALPNEHPEVTRIQFLYGDFRPLTFVGSGVRGYVVFTFTDRTRQAVEMMLSKGEVVAESPARY